MSYLDKHLLPDEQIIFRTKKHFVIFSKPILIAAFGLVLIFLKDFTHVLNPFLNQGLTLIYKYFVYLVFLAALIAAIRIGILYLTSDYVVTNRRVIMREGWLVRRIGETRLNFIAHVSVDQDILGQFLNFGTVIVNNFSNVGDSFEFIDSPLEFQSSVHNQLDKLQRPTSTIT